MRTFSARRGIWPRARPRPKRFGFPVERLVVHQDAPLPDPAIDAAVQASSASLIIARWPAQRYQMPRAVASWERIVIPAGTLTYWGIACQGGPTTQKSLPPGARLASFESCQQNSGSIDAFEAIVRDSFDGYGNHYRANPYLDSSTVVEGYVEWALATLRSDPGSVLTLDVGGELAGFATLHFDAGRIEVLLAGMASWAQGRGWYQALLAGACEAGIRGRRQDLVISTQVENVAVQRAWIKAGLTPRGAIVTVHALHPSVVRQRL